MDRDRVAGIALGVVLLIAVFLIPFGSFQLPSGQLNEVTLFNMVMQLAGSFCAQQPINLLIHEALIMISFIILVIAGTLGFHPLRAGVIGVFGMMLITTASVFNPMLGFNIPDYKAGYFIIWIVCAAAIVIGKLKPNARRKLSFLSSPAAPEKPVETTGPPTDLFEPLASTEVPQASSATKQPESKPYPSVSASVIEEEIVRVRAFMVVLDDEKRDKSISEEAYERLTAKLQRMLDELETEKKKYAKQVSQ